VRWNDNDAITRDPLRMRITYLTSPKLAKPGVFTTDISLDELNNERMAERKFNKFRMDVMPQVTTPISYFIPSCTR
jgi:hypothetical protein